MRWERHDHDWVLYTTGGLCVGLRVASAAERGYIAQLWTDGYEVAPATYHQTARAAKREAIRKALRWLDAQRAPLVKLLGKEAK